MSDPNESIILLSEGRMESERASNSMDGTVGDFLKL
jgi:hypothetical protein